MGLDICVIRETILPRPSGIVYDFAWHLAEQAALYCGGEDNSLYPYLREQLEEEARNFADSNGLTADQLNEILAWLRSLPWDGDYIMLHFNW
ncbi:MAG: hypothetical protein RMJ39_10495 [Deltaproteobacteria bacterium]|nr:hypothetical protein [Deltaproteobacteria bacterium]